MSFTNPFLTDRLWVVEYSVLCFYQKSVLPDLSSTLHIDTIT